MKRLAILISGRGSNMLALADAVARQEIKAEIVLVLSNRADAAGLNKAKERGLPVAAVNRKDFPNRAAFDEQLLAELQSAKPDLVVLAGFMHILSPQVVEAFYGRMINIHPSLLPKYPGLDTHARALANGDKEHGLSIHYVSAEVDAGPIISQHKIEVLPDDTADSLAERLLEQEHVCLVRAVKDIVDGRVRLDTETHQIVA